MRVITGKLKGHSIKSPAGKRTHPMSEKARGAMFSVLGDIKDLTVLDAFAGSGALGIEALSRGAKAVTAIDIDRKAYLAMTTNVEALNLSDSLKTTRANVSSWSANNADLQFDLVFCDPPYDDIRPNILSKLANHVAAGGTYVLSWPSDEKPLKLEDLQLKSQNVYGDMKLLFYKRR